MERYGLPKPDHRPLEAHPTISDTILTRLTHGDITPKPNIARLTERTVVFADGSEEEVDVVVYGTGYKVSFPFFDPGLVSAPDNDLPLFRRVFHPDLPGLYFIALLQPLGATMPLAEAQSEWVCDHLTGRYALPPRAELRADIARERAAMCKRYVASKRHTMQVDYDDYLFELKRERQARRAAGVSRREATKAANRAAILAAARAVFTEHGYEGAGVRDVVRRTDLASGTFYNYFDGKDAVFRAVLEEAGGEARRQVREARLARDDRRGLRARGLPRVLRLHRRRSGDVRLPGAQRRGGPPGGARRAARGPRGTARERTASTSSTRRTRWSPSGCKSGALASMVTREPVAVDEATAFAAGLFAGVLR